MIIGVLGPFGTAVVVQGLGFIVAEPASLAALPGPHAV